MYLSIWFGIMLGSQTGCSVNNDAKTNGVSEVRQASASEQAVATNPLARHFNSPSNLPKVPPAGTRVSYSSVSTDKPVIAMTFDDGPHPSLTPRLLDILKQRNIKATFFVLGSNVRAYPHIVRRMLAEGHEVANHTYTHASLTSRSDDQIRSELQRCDEAIMAAANYRPHLIRPPYGATNARIKEMIYSEFGYATIMWSVDPQDWRRPGVSVVTSRLVNGAHNGAILLAHDIHPPTIEAMPATFDQLLAKGFQFVTVSQLLNLEKANTPVGVVIRPAVPLVEKEPQQLPQ